MTIGNIVSSGGKMEYAEVLQIGIDRNKHINLKKREQLEEEEEEEVVIDEVKLF